MGYVEGMNRDQTVILALDEMVSETSIVRIIAVLLKRLI